MSAADPSLSQSDVRRLEKLARAAGHTPRAMLKSVLRDGFAETERVVRSVQTGRADVRAARKRSHAAVTSEAAAVLANDAKSRQAA